MSRFHTFQVSEQLGLRCIVRYSIRIGYRYLCVEASRLCDLSYYIYCILKLPVSSVYVTLYNYILKLWIQ